MANQYGPWTTMIDPGGSPQLSAFWRRRLVMLVPASQTSPVLSRSNLLLLVAAGILACVLPTIFFTPAVAEEKKPAETATPSIAGVVSSNRLRDSADFIHIPIYSHNDLAREEIRKELKISSEQENKLREICGNYSMQQRKIQDNFQKEFENLTPEESAKKNLEIHLRQREDIKKVRKQIDELLTPEQLDVIKSTAIGNHFGRLLADLRTAKKIGVSEEQLKQLTQLREGEAEKEEFERLTKIMERNEQKMLAVLTPQQLEKLEQNVDKSKTDNLEFDIVPSNAVPVELIGVNDPDIRKELAINAEQQTKLDAIFEQSQSQTQKLIKSADPSKLQQKIQEISEPVRKQIEEVLAPRQLAELKKIALRRKCIQSLYMLQIDYGDDTQSGILDRIGASDEQKTELRRLIAEMDRLRRQNIRESGKKAMKILSPQQQQYLLDELDQLTDSDTAGPPADAAKPADKISSSGGNFSGRTILFDSSVANTGGEAANEKTDKQSTESREQKESTNMREWTLPDGKKIYTTRSFSFGTGKDRLDEIKQLIAEKKYKFLSTFDSPNGEKQYVYQFLFSDGGNTAMNFSMPLENVSSWDDYQQKQEEQQERRQEQINKAIAAGRFRLLNVEAMQVQLCRDVESNQKFKVQRIPRRDGTEIAFPRADYGKIPPSVKETSWQEHLDLIRQGKRALLDLETVPSYTYEMTADDGTKIFFNYGGGEPLKMPEKK